MFCFLLKFRFFKCFVSKSVFWSRSRSEPSFIGRAGADFLPGAWVTLNWSISYQYCLQGESSVLSFSTEKLIYWLLGESSVQSFSTEKLIYWLLKVNSLPLTVLRRNWSIGYSRWTLCPKLFYGETDLCATQGELSVLSCSTEKLIYWLLKVNSLCPKLFYGETDLLATLGELSVLSCSTEKLIYLLLKVNSLS